MMTKKDILELKRRFKKEECTFTRMCGCYVDGNKNQIVKLNETFLNLEDEEFYKYLEIAKKTLSGTIGNNLLELSFPDFEEEVGGKQQFFMALRDSKLKNDDLLDRFYELIIEHYDYAGNYLILIFHDAYDVITKTNDNLKIDESEEVYEYLLCAICPVVLSKPGLGYREDENRIGPRIRDWIVSTPDVGFVFPAFTERSSDIHKLCYYVKDAKDSHAEFVENALGCGSKRTATEQKQTFHAIVKRALNSEESQADNLLMEIQENLHSLVEEEEEDSLPDSEPKVLTANTIAEVLSDIGITDQAASAIEESFNEEFGETLPPVKNLIDEKALAAGLREKKEQELVRQVQELQTELIEKSLDASADEDFVSDRPIKTYDVVLRVKPEKASQIKAQFIGGQKYLVIPMDEDEQVNVNGVNTKV